MVEHRYPSRRTMQIALGFVWLIDGVLQLKPEMFTRAFIQQVILPVSQSQFAWIAHPIVLFAHWITPSIHAWDWAFALVQIALGLALILNILPRFALTLSFVWVLIVWWFGEGFGQLLTGQALTLTGAPGAVLLYGLIGITVWPNAMNSRRWREQGLQFARWSLATLWFLGAILQFQPTYLSPHGLTAAILPNWLAHSVGNHGFMVSFMLGIVQFGLAVWIASGKRLRMGLTFSMVLAFLFWWLGQGFGQIFTPLATDFNSGLLYILLALCVWPWTQKTVWHRSEEHFHYSNRDRDAYMFVSHRRNRAHSLGQLD